MRYLLAFALLTIAACSNPTSPDSVAPAKRILTTTAQDSVYLLCTYDAQGMRHCES
jgi:hypothetical protein